MPASDRQIRVAVLSYIEVPSYALHSNVYGSHVGMVIFCAMNFPLLPTLRTLQSVSHLLSCCHAYSYDHVNLH